MTNPLRSKLQRIRDLESKVRPAALGELGRWVRGRRRADLLRWMAELTCDEWRLLWGSGIPRPVWLDAVRLYARAKDARRCSAGGHSWV